MRKICGRRIKCVKIMLKQGGMFGGYEKSLYLCNAKRKRSLIGV